MEFHFDINLIGLEVIAEDDSSQFDIGIFQRYMGPNKDEASNPFREFDELAGNEKVWKTQLEMH